MNDGTLLPEPEVPLCVDLDGTLIHTDLLLESATALLRHDLLHALLSPVWLLKGRSYLKRRIAQFASLDPALLPYNDPLLDRLRHEKHCCGRRLVLATASDESLARKIAGHLQIFDDVIASDGTNNLTELENSRRLAALFPQGFDYIGNSAADLPIWKASRHATVVNGPKSLVRKAGGTVEEATSIPQNPNPWTAFLRELRPHHWVKNLLVFVPVATAHQLLAGRQFLRALLMVLAFCLCASAIYVINDVVDLEADRRHPVKRQRPLASGALPLWAAWISAPLLLAAAFGVAFRISTAAIAAIAIYLILTVAYSYLLKRLMLLDVICLASLYVWRIVAGHVATHIAYSPWLLSFSLFLFVSLTFSKRTSELHNLRAAGHVAAVRRSYRTQDLEQIKVFGTASAFSAVMVFTMYLNSDTVRELYRQPELLWLLFPMLLYWLCRVWILAARGQLHEDPVLFALKDRTTYLVAGIAAVLLYLATHQFFPRIPFLR